MTKVTKCLNYLDLKWFEELVTFLNNFQEEIFTEDIPPFSTRYIGVLESILEQIKAVYFEKELYEGLTKKAAWMFYCLIRNHPFLNGNKRVAVLALYNF